MQLRPNCFLNPTKFYFVLWNCEVVLPSFYMQQWWNWSPASQTNQRTLTPSNPTLPPSLPRLGYPPHTPIPVSTMSISAKPSQTSPQRSNSHNLKKPHPKAPRSQRTKLWAKTMDPTRRATPNPNRNRNPQFCHWRMVPVRKRGSTSSGICQSFLWWRQVVWECGLRTWRSWKGRWLGKGRGWN